LLISSDAILAEPSGTILSWNKEQATNYSSINRRKSLTNKWLFYFPIYLREQGLNLTNGFAKQFIKI
jgi:hypothetical protein